MLGTLRWPRLGAQHPNAFRACKPRIRQDLRRPFVCPPRGARRATWHLHQHGRSQCCTFCSSQPCFSRQLARRSSRRQGQRAPSRTSTTCSQRRAPAASMKKMPTLQKCNNSTFWRNPIFLSTAQRPRRARRGEYGRLECCNLERTHFGHPINSRMHSSSSKHTFQCNSATPPSALWTDPSWALPIGPPGPERAARVPPVPNPPSRPHIA